MDILPAYHYQFSGLLTAVASISLAILVYHKGIDKYLKRQFFLYYASLFLWAVSLFICTSVYNYDASYLFCQFTHVGAILIPVFFLHFTYAYLDRNSTLERLILRIFYGLAFFFLIICIFFRHLFFGDIVPKLSFPYFPNAGIFYTPWVMTFVIAVMIALGTLLKVMLSTRGFRRKQIRFFLIANLIGYTGGIGCFLPVYNLPYFPFPFGPYGVLLLSFFSGYAILKHRFIDLQLIIKKTILFTSLLLCLTGMLLFIIVIFQTILYKYFNPNPILSISVEIIIIILIYDPLRQFLQGVTDRYLFQKKLDFKKLLKESSQEMASIKSLNKLSKVVVAFLVKKARISQVAVFVYFEGERRYLLKASRPRHSGSVTRFEDQHPLVARLKSAHGPVERDLFKNMAEDGKTPEERDGARQCLDLMDVFKAEVVIPSFLYLEKSAFGRKVDISRLRSILFLGPKKSDEPYSQEDLDVFYTLAQESAIAIENARLYDEALQKTRMLAEMNRELEDANQRLQVTQASLIVAEKNATMVNMAKAIGHEVNNPLSVVRLKAQRLLSKTVPKCFDLLQNDGDSGTVRDGIKVCIEKIDSDLKKVLNSSNRIDGVIQTLTGILRESGGEMEPLSLLLLVQEAKEATRFSTYEENLSGCEITVNVSSYEMIMGDAHRLLQVFINLFKNAYEAMESAGTTNRQILVDGKVDPDDPGQVRIDVRDNGPGIPPDIIDKIWKQDFSTKVKKDQGIGAVGQGQGLFICKHMIESVHKGTIVVESEMGKGTTFIIRLPKADME